MTQNVKQTDKLLKIKGLPDFTGHDPLVTQRAQAGAFNQAWLKNGESLRPFQRAGFIFFSIVHIAIGGFLGVLCWECYAVGNLFFILLAIATIFVAGLGILGLRNAMRFSRTHHDLL